MTNAANGGRELQIDDWQQVFRRFSLTFEVKARSGSDVTKRGNQPGEIGLLLELLLHFAADLAGRVVDFADFGEEGGDLVTAEESSRPSLQQVTQAGLNGSYGGQEHSLQLIMSRFADSMLFFSLHIFSIQKRTHSTSHSNTHSKDNQQIRLYVNITKNTENLRKKCSIELKITKDYQSSCCCCAKRGNKLKCLRISSSWDCLC